MDSMLICGGAGFIGSNFARLALARTNAEVIVLDKLTYAGSLLNLADCERNSRYQFVAGDIGDRSIVDNLLHERSPRWIINFAAETHVDRSIDGPRYFIENNALATCSLLESIRSYLSGSGRRDFRLLHISTDETYGSLGPSGRFDESAPYAPNSPYAASKAAADHFVRAYNHTYGVPAMIAHCSNNYGCYQYPEKLIPKTVLHAIEGRQIPVYGDGENVRDWLFVSDNCEALLAILTKGKIGEAYNVGGGNERRNIDVVMMICRILEECLPAGLNESLAAAGKRSYQDLCAFVEDRPGHDRRYALDCAKIERELGWRASTPLEDGLRRTIRWYLENRAWCDSVRARAAQ
ncbi:MAG TPA: dTDP-glucose 4,6-dehydratase [Candidatus Binataceae bacterium]|nr:dTDP-glucose 4,6-dehydratase [Candidatus Binataceae bacterium]